MSRHAAEVASGERFEFGKNWVRFLANLQEHHIREAEDSLRGMLESENLAGARFLDAGCGSGLFSLAARRLGARVHSFDYDPHSVACAMELRRRYFEGDPEWLVEEGSVLDSSYLAQLGKFEIVYSWGVLHHTGEMWRAMDYVAGLVAPRGKLFLGIYNDQGAASRRWRRVKETYNRLPPGLRFLVTVPAFAHLWWRPMVKDLVRGQPFASLRDYGKEWGMTVWRDLVDWVGGYPFEVAKPEQVFEFCRERGFLLRKLRTAGGGLGCNQLVLQRE